MTRRIEEEVANNSFAGRIDRTVAVKVIAFVLLVCIVGTATVLLGMRIFFGTTVNEPTSIEVQIDAPEEVAVNEPFAVTIQVTSLITTSQLLHSLDLESSYLKNVMLTSTVPPYQTVQSLPLTKFDSYLFAVALPGLSTTAVELHFVGQTPGQFSGLIDVCLDDGNLCLARPLETTVVE